MFPLKHAVIFFILQNTVPSSCFVKDLYNGKDYPDSMKSMTSDDSTDFHDDGDESPDDHYIGLLASTAERKTPKNGNHPGLVNNFIQFPNDSNEDPETGSIENSNENPDYNNNYQPDLNNSNERPEDDHNNIKMNNFTALCPKDHSIISHGDINYLIEQNAEILKIQQHFVNSSYPDAEELITKYEGELEEFLKKCVERPDHLRHILHKMAALRLKLHPEVKKIESQLGLFATLESDMNIVAERSDNKLRQLEKYKNLCQMNCEEIKNRFGQNNNNYPFLVSQSTSGMYCIRLEDLHNVINENLREVQAPHNDSLYVHLDVTEQMYAKEMLKLKDNLKNSAVKLFGSTMYDVLNLQDDYHHFVNNLEQISISFNTNNIRKNIAEIDFKLIGLQTDLEKYRQYCLNCAVNQRTKRNVIDLRDSSTSNEVQERFDVSLDNIADVETVVIELINVKVGEISKNIERNLTVMFEELNRKLNDSKVIDDYLKRLDPIQNQITNEVKLEVAELKELKKNIPQASVDRVLELSKKSKQTIQDLDAAKQFIDNFIKTKYSRGL